MSCWWQDLHTGEIFERPDHATCWREAHDCQWATNHYVYVSNTRIPEGHAQWWRDRGCPETLQVRSQFAPRPELEAWDADVATSLTVEKLLEAKAAIEEGWDAEPEEDVWSV